MFSCKRRTYNQIHFKTSLNVAFIGLLFCYSINASAQRKSKINGVNIVSPQEQIPKNLSQLNTISASWVSVNPVILLRSNDPSIEYPAPKNYKGDSPKNVLRLCKKAKKEGYKVLLKPLFRVDMINWAGDFLLNGYLQSIFENNFKTLMIDFATIAAEEKVEMLCLGTELKAFVKFRPQFWFSLIEDIRKVYPGQLTYAANWDNIKEIPFWNEMDYIGIDAYFPLVNDQTPSLNKLKRAWTGPKKELSKLNKIFNKPILFTEYGYRSIHRTAWKQWEFENQSENSDINMQAQINGYQAIYQSFWNEPWFAGGFIWKWYIDNPHAGGQNKSNYTPQNKPVVSVIKQWYSTSN